MIHHYKDSSSILDPNPGAKWAQKGRHGESVLVPTVRMDALLSIGGLHCWFVKTDMQVSQLVCPIVLAACMGL